MIRHPSKILTDHAGVLWIDAARNMRRLLTRLSKQKKEEFLHAAREGRAIQIRTLLTAGVNPNTKSMFGETALMMAVQNSHRPVVQLLLESGANPDTESLLGETALMMAVRNGDPCVTQLLENLGASR